MSLNKIRSLALLATIALASFACSPNLPPVMKAVPAGTDIVGTIDARASLNFIKKALPKIVPEELKGKIPSFSDLGKQAMMLAGVDIDKLTMVHFFGDIKGSTWTFVAEGLSSQGLKGKPSGKYKGIDLHSLLGSASYAEIKGLGLVLSPNDEELRKVIDTFHGDSKRLADTDKGKLIKDMLKIHKDKNLLRLYILTGKLPELSELPMGMSFKLEGGGLFVDLDKGAALTVLTDKQGADKIAQAVGLGLMTTQAALMMGGGKDMPIKMDEDAKKVFTDFLGKVKTAKKQSGVTISFDGDLKPLIEKAMSLGAKAVAPRPIPMPAVDPTKDLKKQADIQPKDQNKAAKKDEPKQAVPQKTQPAAAK